MSGTQLGTTIEGRYDAVPYNIKEWAGLRVRYINLSHDQQRLVEALLSGEYKSEKELDIVDQLEYIDDLVTEMNEAVTVLMRRYSMAGM